MFTGYGAGNIINAVWAGASKAEQLLNGLGMNGGAATGFAAGMNADTVWTMCAYTSVVAEYGLIGLVLLVIASIVSMTRVFDTASAEHGVWGKTVICWLVLIVYLYIPVRELRVRRAAIVYLRGKQAAQVTIFDGVRMSSSR